MLELLFDKAAGLKACKFIKNICFPVNVANFFRTACFIDHLCWLLLCCDLFEFNWTVSWIPVQWWQSKIQNNILKMIFKSMNQWCNKKGSSCLKPLNIFCSINPLDHSIEDNIIYHQTTYSNAEFIQADCDSDDEGEWVAQDLIEERNIFKLLD